ncbi:MAG: DUF5107 domain-containing protein [Chitinophagaceae bacterium]
MEEATVRVWREKVVIPTYGTGAPDKNPMFFENRVYQGSSGVVYPNPVVEKIDDEKKDKEYIGLFLENEYLKVMILPELGGRVQMAYDKIAKRHFVYYNQVIKPALVGLCGPWISGGIEFNWPQHHRPSTFEPIDFTISENEDGSKTIWVNEVERMFGTKGMAGFVLYPGKAYLEICVTLYNSTPIPQTFLWWANPAVKVNDGYQSVFPPDVNAVFDHGKRDVSDFPIATGTYYKFNYAPGTDISRYKNIPVPTSYMAIHSAYDFLGGYEHDARAGVLHVADHHVSPGKKQWTWGHGNFGQAWERNLTDQDGPYIELMAGVFTDNQPDFSWLMPYEEKTFKQYFLPYREAGMVKNASKDLLAGIEKVGEMLDLSIFATSQQKVVLTLEFNAETLLKEYISINPEKIFSKRIPVREGVTAQNILLVITDKYGKELLRYQPAGIKINEIAEPAQPVLAPEDIATNEQLFLTGQHLEQYRHATCSPVMYYEEALQRDARDIRNNNALGLWYFRKGQVFKSEPYFRTAIEALTQRNPNPYDGEPYYNLGLCLKAQGKNKEAYEAFYKGTWNSSWQHACFFSIAQLDIFDANYVRALDHIRLSLDRNAGNSKAYLIKIVALRKSGRLDAGLQSVEKALKRDLFNLVVYFEQYKIYLLQGLDAAAQLAIEKLSALGRGYEQNYIAYALDYAAAGLYQEAIEFLQLIVNEKDRVLSPMVYYYLGWFYHQSGKLTDRDIYFDKASRANSDYCFPNRLEDIEILALATVLNKQDSKAPYYLGNLWYDKRQYTDAIVNWKLSAQRCDSFPTVLRNLGIAYFNKEKNPPAALATYEKAFSLNNADARVLMELDQLYKRLNKTPEDRLAFLEKHINVVKKRDDLYLETAALYNYLGEYSTAYEWVMGRRFHPWEGGEGKVSGQYYYSLVELAKQQIRHGDLQKAVKLLEAAQTYPDNLGEGKLPGMQENDVFYWLGTALEKMGNSYEAAEFYSKATEGAFVPAVAIVYNDQQPDKIFYQGLAFQKLGDHEKAVQVFCQLTKYGTEHLNDVVKIDYFAVSLPDLLIFDDDLNKRNRVHCHYMSGLGHLGLADFEEAKGAFRKGLEENVMHTGCKTHLQLAIQMENTPSAVHNKAV